MIPATTPVQRPTDAKLLFVDASGSIAHYRRSQFPELLQAGDVLIANNAATLPASLSGTHERTGRPIEVRLAGQQSLFPGCAMEFTAMIFGEGDFHTATEYRANPPELHPGDHLQLGSLRATVNALLIHPRLASIRLIGSMSEIWQGLARSGRAIQYAYIPTQLEMWDTWTPIAAVPAAYEAPSAGFILDWKLLRAITTRGIKFATLTHAAGISSTGDPKLDALLPFPEPYHIPEYTAALIESARTSGARIIAVGTSVVRALEHSFSSHGALRAGEGLAIQRLGPDSTLEVVNAVVSGTHEPGTSHYQLLQSFVDDELLRTITAELDNRGYRTHEFGDSVFIERSQPRLSTFLETIRTHTERFLTPTANLI
jgi:S-adenosylmethionine:tRNA ribosyltransferase-isomerase